MLRAVDVYERSVIRYYIEADSDEEAKEFAEGASNKAEIEGAADHWDYLQSDWHVEVPDKMTANDFAALCGEYLIDPALALEDEEIVKALAAKDRAEVERLVRENF